MISSEQFTAMKGKVRSLPLPKMPARLPAVGAASSGKPFLAINRQSRQGQIDLIYGSQTVGGDPSCDIVILGLAPQTYFSLSLEAAKGGVSAVLHVLSEGVSLNGKPLAKDTVHRMRPSDQLGVDDVVCRLGGVSAPRSVRNKRKRAAAALLALSAVLVTLLVFDSHKGDQTNVDQSAARSVITPPNILIKELRDALRMSSLKLDVELDRNGGEIRIGSQRDSLTLSEKQKLANVLTSFERRSALPISDQTKLTSGLESFIASIAVAPVKFVVGTDGRRYREGEMLADKWRVEAIQPGGVVVSRDGRRDVIATGPAPAAVSLYLANRE